MISNRQRGLLDLHNTVSLLAITVFFWVYSELIMRYVPVVRLSREVNLLPYFLCVVIGMLASTRITSRAATRFTHLSSVEAAGLAMQQTALMALVVFTMMFATLDRSISRLFLGSFLLWTWLILTCFHLVLPRTLAQLVYGRNTRVRTLFIGEQRSFAELDDWLKRSREVGLEPVGFLTHSAPSSQPSGTPEIVGTVADLDRSIEQFEAGQVVMLEVPADPDKAKDILSVCQERGCRLLIHHDMDERLEHPLSVVEESGHQFLTLMDEPLEEPLNRLAKRMLDIVVAVPAVLLVLPPLFVSVWIAQQLQSRGPLLHVRERTGVQRSKFKMYKFRTMHLAPADEKAEARQAVNGDGRVYPFGRFLRRHSLDEFPQFWNVLRGEMSVVGPRPVMPLLDAEFERRVRAYRSKHWVKPGITGLAQSRGFRGEVRDVQQLQDRIRLDLTYIAHWSIWLDLEILLTTVRQVLFPPPSAI